MKLHKFCGRTSREVLQQIRDQLGQDALIISNRQTAAGIEILATAAGAMESWMQEDSSATTAVRKVVFPQADPSEQPINRPLRNEQTPLAAEQVEQLLEQEIAQPTSPPMVIKHPQQEVDEQAAKKLLQELKAMRGAIEQQLAHLAWGDSLRRSPQRSQLNRQLLVAGFSPLLAREITQRLPDDYSANQAQQWLSQVLAKNLHCIEAADDLVTRGGVYALIGPTGVGKTTTAAKLAARCAVKYGASKLALLTTDGYRIGAQDQLRIYAKILGVTVHAIRDENDFRLALMTLRDKHLILIDTVGMGQRDERVLEQATLLEKVAVQRLLLLSANSQAETLEEVVHHYRGEGLAGAIVTKLDEAVRPGHVLDILIRHNLPLHYVSNGQRVPEDLHHANALYLLDRALKPSTPSAAFALQDDEISFLMAGAASTQMKEVAHV